MYLESNKPNYKLDLNLSYPVDEDNGNAKFDKAKRKLTVTLPVKQQIIDLAENSLSETLPSVEEVTSSPTAASEAATTKVEASVEEPKEETVISVKTENSTSSIKYCLPSNYKFEQNSTYLKLKFFIKNFNETSFSISTSAKSLSLKYETVSNGGYITYYAAFLDFVADFIDLSANHKLQHKNIYSFDEYILIEFKKLNNICIEKVYVSADSKDENRKVRFLNNNLVHLECVIIF